MEDKNSIKKSSRILRTPEEICEACNEYIKMREDKRKQKEERYLMVFEFCFPIFFFLFLFLLPKCF